MLPVSTDLLESFLAESWETISALEGAEATLRGSGHNLETLSLLTHRLHGSAGLYGFPQVANLSGLLEQLLEQLYAFGTDQRKVLLDFFQQSTICLKNALKSITLSRVEGDVGYELSQSGASALLMGLISGNPDVFLHEKSFEDVIVFDSNNEDSKVSPSSIQDTLRAFANNDAETWSYFAPEVTEHVEMISIAIEALLTGNDVSHLQQIFRSMHTIKGAAYSVGLQPMGALAHRLEDLLVAVREGGRAWDVIVANAVVQGTDSIGAMLAVAEGRPNQLISSLERTSVMLEAALGSAELGFEFQEVLVVKTVSDAKTARHKQETPSETNDISEKKPQETTQLSSTPQTLRVGLDKIENLLNLSGETVTARSRFDLLLTRYRELTDQLEFSRARFERMSAEFVERYLNPRLSNTNGQTQNEDISNTTSTSIGRGLSTTELFSELEFDQYNDLNILARSIGEMANDLNELQIQLAHITDGFKAEVASLEKLSRNLRTEVGQMRLVPIGRLMTRLRRQARQMAGDKQFKIELIGELVEVDNVILEGLSGALLHVISNAVAHGIETTQTRIEAGKNHNGLIQIRAFRRGNFVFIEIQDDGAGIDVQAVRAQAIQNGLRSASEIEKLSNQEALALVFLPGLSTAPMVSEISGRGVGMDAVWSGLRRLKGDVTLESQPGLGTLVQLKVPLTLVVSEILLLESGGVRYAIPRENVRSLRAIDRSNITKQDGVCYALLEGETFRVLEMNQLMGFKNVSAQNPTRASLVALEIGENQRVAIEVDTFIGLEQAVVKPLESPFNTFEHLIGATIDNEGRVILVLDALGTAQLSDSNRVRFPSAKAVSNNLTINTESHPKGGRVLLVDDSLSVRRVVGERIKRLGYEVITAIDGQEALDFALQQSFDAIVTDLEMPKLNGFELVESLRRQPQFAAIPIAMLTSRATEKHAKLAFELGINEYLTKPLDDAKLESFLARINIKDNQNPKNNAFNEVTAQPTAQQINA